MKTNIGDINNLAFRKEKSDYNFGTWILGISAVLLFIYYAVVLTLIFN